jgi:hypothetical protein
MKEPRYFRARVALLKELIAKEIELHQGDDRQSKLIPILRSGKFPESVKEYEDLIEDKQKDYTNEPLTHLEIFSFNTYFTLFPQLVAGVEKDGSGFLNPIEIEGDYALIDQITDIDLPQLPSSLNQTPASGSTTDPKVDISTESISRPIIDVSQPVMKIPSGYKFNFSGVGHTTKKDKTVPAIESELLAQLSKLGAENLWNKPRHDNSLIFNISGHRIELFFEDVVKMNVITSLTFAGTITFNNKSVEHLAAHI